MSVGEGKRFRFNAMIWNWTSTGPYWFQSKRVEKKKKGFKTEKEAVDWCERTVEMIVISDGLQPQFAGSGI